MQSILLNRTAIKIFTIIVLLLLAPFAWVPLIYWQTTALIAFDANQLAIKYFLASLISLLAIIGVPFLRNNWARWLFVTIFVVGFILDYVARLIQGNSLSVHMFSSFYQAREETGHALGTFTSTFVYGFVLLLVLAPGLLMKPVKGKSLGLWFLLVPIAAFSSVYYLINLVTGVVEEYPSPIAVPIQAYLGIKFSPVYLGPRDALKYAHPVSPKINKIVFIVDESIRGDYLQLNNTEFDNTPFLASHRSQVANFGVASSYANCSAMSRMALRSGARDSNFPDPKQKLLRQPTMWQYAKLAGYRTVYLDGWKSMRNMHSNLTDYELKFVDERTDASLIPYSSADDHIADRVSEELAKPGPVFIFVEKIGLHTPYPRSLPKNPEYEPNASTVPFASTNPTQSADVKDYLIGVWSRVDLFFERLFPALNQSDVLAIYTSDHGQALYEGGYDAMHCSGKNASKGEGLVPLFLFAGDQKIRKSFRSAAKRSYNKASHSDIFPTLLWAMGFDPELVKPKYSRGLANIPDNRKRRFFIFHPFKKTMDWIPVD